MIARGNFVPGRENQFASYLALFEPILEDYFSETFLIGGGLPLEGTDFWDMTWVVKFPDEKMMSSFLSDPRVLGLRKTREKEIYAELSFSFFTGQAPKI
jgi:uncharacterized protein (DUF1330 family)